MDNVPTINNNRESALNRSDHWMRWISSNEYHWGQLNTSFSRIDAWLQFITARNIGIRMSFPAVNDRECSNEWSPASGHRGQIRGGHWDSPVKLSPNTVEQHHQYEYQWVRGSGSDRGHWYRSLGFINEYRPSAYRFTDGQWAGIGSMVRLTILEYSPSLTSSHRILEQGSVTV